MKRTNSVIVVSSTDGSVFYRKGIHRNIQKTKLL